MTSSQLIVGLALVLLLNSSWVIALMIVVGEPQDEGSDQTSQVLLIC